MFASFVCLGKHSVYSQTIFSAMSRVFLGRLAFDARERDVEKFLRGFGRIREISLKKGYGFVVRIYICVHKINSDKWTAYFQSPNILPVLIEDLFVAQHFFFVS